MKVVMPAVVPHSEGHRFLSMGRYEVGKGGNPHVHGFCVGEPAPTLGGKLIMDVDRVPVEEGDVDMGGGASPEEAADDALSVGAASAGVESAQLSSTAPGSDRGDGDVDVVEAQDAAAPPDAVLDGELGSAAVGGIAGVADEHAGEVGGQSDDPGVRVGGRTYV